MVESLKELNQKCQKPNYKTVGNWMVRKILRPAALPITWLLLHTPVTANQVTFASMIVGFAGIGLMALKGTGAFVLGVLLLQFWYLLDHVDGQIARYRGTVSLTGRFFDFMMHHMLHGVLFFALGCHAFLKTGHAAFLTLGFFTSYFLLLFNLLSDAKSKTYFEHISKLQALYPKKPEEGPGSEGSSPRRLFSFLHKTIEMHVAMNILTFASLVEYAAGLSFFRTAALVYYSLLLPPLFLVKLFYIIERRKIDQEFHGNFKTEPESPVPANAPAGPDDERRHRLDKFFTWMSIVKNWPLRIMEKAGMAKGDLTYKLRNGISITLHGGLKDSDALILWDIYANQPYTRDPLTLQEGQTIVDIGGHVGLFATWAASHPGVKVYVYEANPGNYQYLRKNIDSNHFTNIQAFPCAVSGKKGVVSLYLHEEGSGGNSLYREHVRSSNLQSVEVPSVTLEDVLTENKIEKVDFLKIDCEGAEYAILKSATPEALKKINKIAIEYHKIPGFETEDLVTVLQRNGFQTEFKPQLGSILYAWKS